MPRLNRDRLTERQFSEHQLTELSIPRKIREYVLKRDSYMCRRCAGEHDLELHHIGLRSHGRDNHPNNLMVLCARCHRWYHNGKCWFWMDEYGDVFWGGSRQDLYSRLEPYETDDYYEGY